MNESFVFLSKIILLPFAEHSPKCFWSPDHHNSVLFLLVSFSETKQMSTQNRTKKQEVTDCYVDICGQNAEMESGEPFFQRSEPWREQLLGGAAGHTGHTGTVERETQPS